ncbi:hypothetical protein ABIE41_000108 [Bosea sp. OAE506]|uniref:Abi family protein n=1 Tax=Bosea sp. OAE506 TaxID=2663870 RepID=UPI001789F203
MPQPVIDTMSQRRFETYLQAAGHNRTRAVALYIWNAKIGASFHIPIQAAEVALRNRVNHALVSEFGAEWWRETRYLNLADRERERDLETVKSRLVRKGIRLETDQIVAGLSFGFWVGMLHRRYNPPIWGARLRATFPHLPTAENRESLFRRCGEIAGLRNRISHHEPLIKLDAMKQHSDLLKLLSWICPATAQWVRPHCDLPTLVRAKP